MADQEQPKQSPKSETPKTPPPKPQMPKVVEFTRGDNPPVKGK